tara:strand:+ start:174 stop:470 length:297 start_codon:yes stop_codon:yes gene_type:complete
MIEADKSLMDSGNEVVYGIKDLSSLVLSEEYTKCIEIICREATLVKFTVESRAARKRAMDKLKGYLSNVQQHARAEKEDRALRQDFKKAWSLCYDASR